MDPNEIKITFGKYKGKTVAEVFKIDRGYLGWCRTQPGIILKNPNLVPAIKICKQNFMKANGTTTT